MPSLRKTASIKAAGPFDRTGHDGARAAEFVAWQTGSTVSQSEHQDDWRQMSQKVHS